MSMKIPFFKQKESKANETSDSDNMPRHVAVIMDGNGRWAKKRGLPRIAGHKAGMDVVRDVAKAAANSDIETLTLYAFSTENWRRPTSEVNYLLSLPKEFLHIYLPELIENNVRVETIGDSTVLPDHTKDAVNDAKSKTMMNDGLLLNFALNYGSRYEMIEAIKQIAADVDDSALSLDELDEDVVSRYLYTNNLSDPDLLIRTSGEQRLSNFLLWQCAYSELWFTDILWPDFTADTFRQALTDYQQRKRRYGGV
ncbi:isoprenyl transferase [Barrientosiimonas marina]|uniref:Isoprenyl transferase n=1 Tax=Lentibacillus kimchii TaxID=1542911 RepID=A0ABW2UTH1_9BACI